MINLEKSKQTFKFTRSILLMDAIFFIIAGYPIYVNYGQEMLLSVLIGFIVTSIGFIVALYLIEIKYDDAFNTFMALVMGSMLAKMFFFSGAILFVFIFSLLHQIGFTIAVLISYLYKSVTEIIFINKISSKSRLPR
ncbi:MAG: hypothetical protein WD037_11915 [Balneolales bacterium]